MSGGEFLHTLRKSAVRPPKTQNQSIELEPKYSEKPFELYTSGLVDKSMFIR